MLPGALSLVQCHNGELPPFACDLLFPIMPVIYNINPELNEMIPHPPTDLGVKKKKRFKKAKI